MCSYLSIGMGMENLELGLVQTKKVGEMPKTTRFQGEFLQVFVWGCERNDEDGKRSFVKAY